MKLKTALVPLTMPLLLAACLGGGGGNGGGGSSGGQSGPLTLGSTPTADFTSFAAIQANSLVELPSGGGSLNYNATTITNDPLHVGRTGDLSTEASSTVRILTGDELPDGEEDEFEVLGTRLTVNIPGRSAIVRDFFDEPTELVENPDYVVFELSEPVEVDDGEGGTITVDRITDQLYVNEGEDLEFMTFGIWAPGQQETSADLGGSAWGAITPEASLATITEATYNGSLIGYNVIDGETLVLVADSTVFANFAADEVSLSSLGTTTLDGDDRSDFDLVTVTPASISGGEFAGGVLSMEAGDFFDGAFGGAFYGPQAEEVGGWFNIQTRTVPPGIGDRYFGSFGGAQVAP